MLRKRPSRAVYLSEGAATDDLDRQLIESASSGGFSFHVVERADIGSLTLKDILTGNRVRVLEDQGNAKVEPGSLLFALPVTTDSGSILVGCSTLVMPPTWHNQVIDFREEIWPGRRPTAADLLEHDIEIRDFYFDIVEALLDPQPPTLTNTDGELIRLDGAHLRFDMQRAGDLRRAAKPRRRRRRSHSERVTLRWQDADGPLLGLLTIEPGRLTGDVNSAERAERLRAEVASRLGDRAAYAGSQETAVEDLMDERLDESADASPISTRAALNCRRSRPRLPRRTGKSGWTKRSLRSPTKRRASLQRRRLGGSGSKRSSRNSNGTMPISRRTCA